MLQQRAVPVVVAASVPVVEVPKALTRAEIHVMGPKKKGRTGAKLRKIVPDPDDAQGFKVLGGSLRFFRASWWGWLSFSRAALTPAPSPPYAAPHRTRLLPTVHCFHLCGVVYSSPTRDDDQQEWSKTLRRLNAHESKRCVKRDMNKPKRPKRVAKRRRADASGLSGRWASIGPLPPINEYFVRSKEKPSRSYACVPIRGTWSAGAIARPRPLNADAGGRAATPRVAAASERASPVAMPPAKKNKMVSAAPSAASAFGSAAPTVPPAQQPPAQQPPAGTLSAAQKNDGFTMSGANVRASTNSRAAIYLAESASQMQVSSILSSFERRAQKVSPTSTPAAEMERMASVYSSIEAGNHLWPDPTLFVVRARGESLDAEDDGAGAAERMQLPDFAALKVPVF